MEMRKNLKRVKRCKGCGQFVEVDKAGEIKSHKHLISGKWCEGV